MAEISIWDQEDAESSGPRAEMSETVAALRTFRSLRSKTSGTSDISNTSDTLVSLLERLRSSLSAQGLGGELANAEFGRQGGHPMVMELLDKSDDESVRDLAAEVVEVCMSKCPKFPMKAAVVDAQETDRLRCRVEIDSELNKIGQPLSVHLKRRPAGSQDTDSNPAIAISNMLWAGSVVLVRYFQANPQILERFGDKRLLICEVGAGLGAGGLGVALLLKTMGLSAEVHITDFDPDSVALIEQCIRSNGLDGGDDRITCYANVLDWDRVDDYITEHELGKCDLVIGAEIVHEIEHAQGVFNAVRKLMDPAGQAVIINGAPKHRFGCAEFQEMMHNAPDLDYSVSEPQPELLVGMESLKEKMLTLQLHLAEWKAV